MKLKHYDMDKIISDPCLDCNNCMACETCQTWLGLDEEWLSSIEYIANCSQTGMIVVQVLNRNSNSGVIYRTLNSHIDKIRTVLSLFFSFGVFRDNVYNKSFESRIHLYSLAVTFWTILSLLIGIIISLKTTCISWGALGFIGFFTLSYGGFQMLDFESKNLRFYRYCQDENGIWELNRISNIDKLYNRKYLEYLLPGLFFCKRIKFLYSLARCNSILKVIASTQISQYLDQGVIGSERLFAVVNRSLYRIRMNNNR